MYNAEFDLCPWHKMDTRAVLVVQQVCKEFIKTNHMYHTQTSLRATLQLCRCNSMHTILQVTIRSHSHGYTSPYTRAKGRHFPHGMHRCSHSRTRTQVATELGPAAVSPIDMNGTVCTQMNGTPVQV